MVGLSFKPSFLLTQCISLGSLDEKMCLCPHKKEWANGARGRHGSGSGQLIHRCARGDRQGGISFGDEE